jgi:hypothetical protein
MLQVHWFRKTPAPRLRDCDDRGGEVRDGKRLPLGKNVVCQELLTIVNQVKVIEVVLVSAEVEVDPDACMLGEAWNEHVFREVVLLPNECAFWTPEGIWDIEQVEDRLLPLELDGDLFTSGAGKAAEHRNHPSPSFEIKRARGKKEERKSPRAQKPYG